MNETKKCPFCGEEILATAKKCKHCGEWLQKENSTEKVAEQNKEQVEGQEDVNNGNSSFSQRISTSVIGVLVGLGLFHFGSWHIVLNKHLTALAQLMLEIDNKSDFILDGDGVLIRINDAYYGFVKNTHYFDSPVIQWIMFLSALAIFFFAIEHLLGFDD